MATFLTSIHQILKSTIMKNYFFIAVLTILTATNFYAQPTRDFGFKVGLNYNANGNYFETVNSNLEHPDRNIGFHFGLFGKFGENLYLKPELVYTSTKSDYTSSSFKMQKVDLPVLVGLKILGPISVFAGPSFQYILDSKFESISIKNIDNDLSVGINLGIGLNLNKIGIDLRYERGFSNNEASFLNNNNIDTSRLDTRPNQLILSLSFIL